MYALGTSTNHDPTCRFGVEVPRSVKHALYLDNNNNNDFWQEAVGKERKQLNDLHLFRSPTKLSLADHHLPGHLYYPFDSPHSWRNLCPNVMKRMAYGIEEPCYSRGGKE